MAPLVETPNVPINYVKATSGEVIKLGQITMRIMEDGSRTGKWFVLFWSSASEQAANFWT